MCFCGLSRTRGTSPPWINRNLHAIDATPARWRDGGGLAPLGAIAAPPPRSKAPRRAATARRPPSRETPSSAATPRAASIHSARRSPRRRARRRRARRASPAFRVARSPLSASRRWRDTRSARGATRSHRDAIDAPSRRRPRHLSKKKGRRVRTARNGWLSPLQGASAATTSSTMAFHSRRPSGPSASKQLPASCSARDQGADPAATTHSGSVSSSFARPNAFRVPGATWISSGVASPMPSMRKRKPPRPTYFDNTTPPLAVAVTTTSSDRTKLAGNCQHLSLNNATSLRGLRAATHPAASASVDAANLTVPRAVLTENWCGRSRRHYSPRLVNIGTIHAAAFPSSHPRIISTGFGPPKLAGLDPAEALGPVERGLLLLEEAAPRLRLRYGRRGLARRGGAEGVVAGRAAAEAREVEGHFFFCGGSWAVLPSAWCGVYGCCRVLGTGSLGGSARREGDW